MKSKTLTQSGILLISTLMMTACSVISPDSGGSLPSLSPVKVNLPFFGNGGNNSESEEGMVVDRGLYNAVIAKSGDTMDTLARRAGVSVEELASANGVSTNYQPRVGQEFVIPGSGAAKADNTTTSSNTSTTTTQAGNETKDVIHTVAAGETIYSIARLYGVSVSRIAAANNINTSTGVHEGQKIIIPGGDEIETTTVSTTTSTQTQSSTAFAKPVSGSIATGFNPSGGSQGYIYKTAAQAPVMAAAAGEVVLISESTGANGTIVMVKHSNGIISVYGRLGNVNVTKGQQVSKGQSIGATAGTELLFQLRQGTASVDPATYLG